MKIGDLVKLRRPDSYPGDVGDFSGLLIDIEEPTNKIDADDAGGDWVCTVMWPPGKCPSATGKPISRHYDIEMETVSEDR